MEIQHYKPVDKGSLIGKFNLKIPKWGNFVIKEMTYFKKETQRWISFPSRMYEKDGKKSYFIFNSFEDAEIGKAFQTKVLEALDKYLASNPQHSEMPKDDFSQQEIPF